MKNNFWDRVGASTGILFVVLFVGGFFGIDLDRPEFGIATAEQVREFVADGRIRLFLHAHLPALGGVAFVWFLGSLRTALAGVEQSGRLTSVVFGSGLLTAGLFLAFHGVWGELSTASLDSSDDVTVLSRWAIMDASFGFFGGTSFLRAALMGATSLTTIRFGGLPRWFGWVGIVTALLNLIDGFDVLADLGLPLLDFYLFLAWVTVASTLLVIRPDGMRLQTPVAS